jgi:hypothetical protein
MEAACVQLVNRLLVYIQACSSIVVTHLYAFQRLRLSTFRWTKAMMSSNQVQISQDQSIEASHRKKASNSHVQSPKHMCKSSIISSRAPLNRVIAPT